MQPARCLIEDVKDVWTWPGSARRNATSRPFHINVMTAIVARTPRRGLRFGHGTQEGGAGSAYPWA
ncbi:MAG: hypothetical protein ACR2MP_16890 [Streptosporangiaceae bacterium]